MTFIDLSNIESREIIPGFHVKFIHSDNMTFAYWTIDKGAELPEHSHPHEQVANLIEGTFEMVIGGEKKKILPGEVAIIPSDVVHKGKAITKCRIIDIFHPIREDYR
jgi:quercetin dioxygenase-like cupin family protein